MLFQHINRHADKHRKRVYLVLVAVIGLSFIVFMGPKGCDRPGDRDKQKIGEMFGRKITLGEFRQARQETNLATIVDTGRSLSDFGVGENQINMITVRRMQALHEARKLRLDAVTDGEFIEYVKTRPAFMDKDRAFNKERLDNVRENLIRSMRISGADFDRVLRESIAVQRVESRALNGVVVSPTEAHDSYIRNNEAFGLSYAKVGIDSRADGDPLDADLQTYFDAHKGELLLPASKVIRVISFPLPKAITAKDIPEEKLKERFEALKDSSRFKGQTFEKARAEILKFVLADEPRMRAKASADAMLKALKNGPEDESVEALATRAKVWTEEHEGTLRDSKPFKPDAKILPDFPKLRQLAQGARFLSKADPLSRYPFLGPDAYHVTMFLKTVPGEKAEKLAQVREGAVKRVLAEKAVALFKEKALPHAAVVKDMTELNVSQFAGKKLEESDAKTTDERRAVWEKAETLAKRYLKPGFKPEQRTAWVAQFPTQPLKKEAEALIDEAQVMDYFGKKENATEYKERKELRASQIFVNLARDADAKTKASARKRAEGILKRIRGGESFELIAQNESDDTKTKAKGGDMGFAKEGSQYGLDETLADLEVGELSDVVETWRGLVILKLTDKRDGVPFDEAKDKIRSKLVDEKAAAIAKERATILSEALIKSFDSTIGSLPEDAADSAVYAVAQRIFGKTAKEQGVELTKITEPFGATDPLRGVYGGGREVKTSVSALSLHSPFTDPVESSGNQFVAMLNGVFPGRMYNLADEEDIIVDRFSEAVRKDNARTVAEAKAKALREAYAAAEDGKQPEGEKTKLEALDPFTRANVNELNSRNQSTMYMAKYRFQKLPQVGRVVEEIDKAKAKPGTLLDVIEDDQGYVVIRVDSRTLPAEDGFDNATREQHEDTLRDRKRATARGTLYRRLEKEAKTTLFGEDFDGRD